LTIDFENKLIQTRQLKKKKVNPTYPPPIVIIFESAAINSSEPWPKPLSPSMPTHGYFARSGYNENKNVSPVPK
jgi:hypothetical protein